MDHTRRSIVFAGTAAAVIPFFSFSATAKQRGVVFANRRGAIRGYDPVAYFTDGKPVKGSNSLTTEWNGAKWSFASAENLATFEAAPAKYAPAFGGYCAWAVANGYVASTVPEAWDIVDGRLYLNFSLNVRTRWRVDVPGHVRSGNRNWPQIRKDLA
ncbi:MAG: YHS domain-containing (seleno)protein [Pseudomonadota bacterium]